MEKKKENKAKYIVYCGIQIMIFASFAKYVVVGSDNWISSFMVGF